MNEAQALHALARRYCDEKHAHWCDVYAALPDKRAGGGYTDEALRTFPRYHVLNAIRVELDRFDVSRLDDLDGARASILHAGATAQDLFTHPPGGPLQAAAMAEERDAFRAFVSGLADHDLVDVEPLLHRRTLAPDEAKRLWAELRALWKLPEDSWYPVGYKTVDGVEAFHASAFDDLHASGELVRLLEQRGVARVWELREYGPEYEQALALFEPIYNGAEGYWFSADHGWIVYASHESSVTVGGWLLDDIKTVWPDWERHLWTPFEQ